MSPFYINRINYVTVSKSNLSHLYPGLVEGFLHCPIVMRLLLLPNYFDTVDPSICSNSICMHKPATTIKMLVHWQRN